MKNLTTKQQAALRKLIRLNGWSRASGHPDAMISKITKLLADAGFKEVDTQKESNPDGSYVGRGTFYRHSFGFVAKLVTDYGATAWSNFFSFKIRGGL